MKIICQQVNKSRRNWYIPKTNKLPKLKQEEIVNLNRLITNNEIELVIKNHWTNKSPALGGFPGEFYQTCKEELIPILCKLFQNIEIEGKLTNSYYKDSIILTPKPEKDPTKKKRITGQYP